MLLGQGQFLVDGAVVHGGDGGGGLWPHALHRPQGRRPGGANRLHAAEMLHQPAKG